MKLIHFFIIFVLLIAASLGVTIVSTKGEPTTLLYVAEGLCVVALLFPSISTEKSCVLSNQ